MAGRNRSFSQRLKRLSQNVERVVGNCKAERDNPDLLISARLCRVCEEHFFALGLDQIVHQQEQELV